MSDSEDDNTLRPRAKRHSRCTKYWYCNKQCGRRCNRVQNIEVDHVCYSYRCNICSLMVDPTQHHLCYIRALALNDKRVQRFICFDFECCICSTKTCDTGYTYVKKSSCSNTCSRHTPCSSACRKCQSCGHDFCGRVTSHHPNFLYYRTSCDHCFPKKDYDPNSKCYFCGVLCNTCGGDKKKRSKKPCLLGDCGKREGYFDGDDCLNKFGQFLFHNRFTGYLALSQNGGRYDSIFLMEYALSVNLVPSVLYNGSKLISFKVKQFRLTVGDSCLQIPLALKLYAKSFNLDQFEGKGTFPHSINTPRYQNYVGQMPPLEAYDIDTMSPEARQKVIDWHADMMSKNYVFDFKKELHSYCRMDVLLLTEGVMVYRQLMLETTQIDPWLKLTISSFAMAYFRTYHLTERFRLQIKDPAHPDQDPVPMLADKKGGQFYNINTDCQEPIPPCDIVSEEFLASDYPFLPHGKVYASSSHSKQSMEWLFYKSHEWNVPIRHAYTPQGEFTLPFHNIKVDGYCPARKLILEFYG